ncbi:hypothetical protein BXZ70DRAFT_249954 [Cristinia sonorae]|uniref:Uncharacterized protein n=1 Tax=Cristinia sonorae TaxID=1940300 RepID=A0A8K0UZB8_9AGAR|nr:hypothetical protein BXZ70DRAFT_249954 [Cristinia sonorae]
MAHLLAPLLLHETVGAKGSDWNLAPLIDVTYTLPRIAPPWNPKFGRTQLQPPNYQDAGDTFSMKFMLPSGRPVQQDDPDREPELFPVYEGKAQLLFSYLVPLRWDENIARAEGISGEIIHDAHLAHHRGQRSSLVIPLFCVADPENILSLVTSVVYQRHILSTYEPAVGISFDVGSCVGRVVIGWLDPSATNRPVYITTASLNTKASPLNGVFDFSSYEQTCMFVEFILEFRKDLGGFKNDQLRITEYCWRSDHIFSSRYCHSEWSSQQEQPENSIAAWLRSTTPRVFSDELEQPEPLKTTSVKEPVKADSLESSTRNGKSVASSTGGSIATPNSSFVKRDQSLGGPNVRCNMASWQFERLAFSLPTFIPSNSGLINQVDDNVFNRDRSSLTTLIDIYNNTTRELWPSLGLTAHAPLPSGSDQLHPADTSIVPWNLLQIKKDGNSEDHDSGLGDADVRSLVTRILDDAALGWHQRSTTSLTPNDHNVLQSLERSFYVIWGSLLAAQHISSISGATITVDDSGSSVLDPDASGTSGASRSGHDFDIMRAEGTSESRVSHTSTTDVSRETESLQIAVKEWIKAEYTTNEATSRLPWDMLINGIANDRMYCSVISELSIKTSKNRVQADSIILEAQAKLFKGYQNFFDSMADDKTFCDVFHKAGQQLFHASTRISKLNADLEHRVRLSRPAYRTEDYGKATKENPSVHHVGNPDEEPASSRCDLALVIPLRNFFQSTIEQRHKGNCQLFSPVSLESKTYDGSGQTKKDEEPLENRKQASTLLGATAFGKERSSASKQLQNVLRLVHEVGEPLGPDDLMIPQLIVEYKKPPSRGADSEQRMNDALSQCRVGCVSVAQFLTELGIYDWPIFGLAAAGTVGTIIAASVSKESKHTYILEYGTKIYDISDPSDIFQLAVVIRRIRARCEEFISVLATKHGSEEMRKVKEMLFMTKDEFKKHWWAKSGQSKLWTDAGATEGIAEELANSLAKLQLEVKIGQVKDDDPPRMRPRERRLADRRRVAQVNSRIRLQTMVVVIRENAAAMSAGEGTEESFNFSSSFCSTYHLKFGRKLDDVDSDFEGGSWCIWIV